MTFVIAVTGGAAAILLIVAGIAGIAFGTFLNRRLAKRRHR